MEQKLMEQESVLCTINGTGATTQTLSRTVAGDALKLQLAQTIARRNLESQGFIFCKDGCTVQLADSVVNGEHLTLCMRCLKNDGNQLVYVIFEKMGNVEYGIESKKQYITDKQIDEAKNVIDNIINSFTGIYEKRMASIKVAISIIHLNRLLKGLRAINTETFPLAVVIDRLKEWILINASDARVKIMELRGVRHIVIVCPKGYKKGVQVGGIFKQIFNEIAPDNNFGAFKAELVRRGLLLCDKNDECLDIQKTISRVQCEKLGTDHVKVICFDFDDKFVEQVAMNKMNWEIDIDDGEIEEMFVEGDKLACEYCETDEEV